MNDAIRARTVSMPPPELCPRRHHRARGEAAPHWPARTTLMALSSTRGAGADAGYALKLLLQNEQEHTTYMTAQVAAMVEYTGAPAQIQQRRRLPCGLASSWGAGGRASGDAARWALRAPLSRHTARG